MERTKKTKRLRSRTIPLIIDNVSRLHGKVGPISVFIDGRQVDQIFYLDRLRGEVWQFRADRDGRLLVTPDGRNIQRRRFHVDPRRITVVSIGRPWDL
jgi:hypothetical protein